MLGCSSLSFGQIWGRATYYFRLLGFPGSPGHSHRRRDVRCLGSASHFRDGGRVHENLRHALHDDVNHAPGILDLPKAPLGPRMENYLDDRGT